MSLEHSDSGFLARDPVDSVSKSDDGILELTGGMARGDEESWAQFYDQYHRRLRGYLAACWRGEPECLDDLLQETFVRAVKHMKPFQHEASFWSWLIVLARSAVADRGRKETRLRRFLKTFRIERPIKVPSDEGLQAALAKLSTDEELLDSLAHLGPVIVTREDGSQWLYLTNE